MSVVIFGDSFTFPDGNAATNRVHTYAKGFYENGVIVHVICFTNEYLKTNDGITNGIFFYHPFGQSKRNKYFVVRRWQNLIKYLKTIKLFWVINKNEKITATICYTQLLNTLIINYFLSKLFRFKTLLERSEHPLRNYQNSYFRRIKGNIILFFETRSSNGFICISQYLIDLYKKKSGKKKKFILIPSTVDNERFHISSVALFPYQYILYCGGITERKDGVHILIKSFNQISEKYPEIKLVLIGKADWIEEEKSIKRLVKSLNIDKRVIFLGQLSRTEIPTYLINAKILTLARPKSMIADAGFPSKLTEYLATGVPIVITKVGEIPLYLKDNINAFISESDSVDAFASKLDFVLNNYEFAKQIASKGKELTNTIFNYNYQAKRIIQFIETL